MTRSDWNTYHTASYTYDAANHPPSTGGVHHHQVQQLGSGRWVKRILQANGSHFATGPVEPLTDEQGESAFQTALSH